MQAGSHRWLAPLLAAGVLLALQACGSMDDGAAATQTDLSAVASGPVSDGGVTPYIVDEPGPGGNVTCEQIGFEYGSERVNFGSGGFDASFPAGITVEVTEGTFVDWTSTFGIGAVIVKGSAAANVYEYDPASLGDGGLAAPLNASGGPAGLSNLTFCWDEIPQEEEPELEVSKTAETTYKRAWDWMLDKVEVQETTVLWIPVGETATANYQLTVGLEALEDSGWMVEGEITIANVSGVPATIIDIADAMTGDIEVDVDCGDGFTLPHVLAAGETLVCSYASDLPDGESRTNTATVTLEGDEEFTGSAAVEFDEPAENDLDDTCVQVWDNLGTGDVNVLSDFVYFGDVCFHEETGLYLRNLTGEADAEIVGDAAIFTYDIEIGSDGNAAAASTESVVPNCEDDDREFTNRAKVRFSDGSYVFDEWTITIEEGERCSPDA